MIDAGTGEEGGKDMKGKIFAMFAVFAMVLTGFAVMGSASATTYTLSVWVNTDKERYNPTDDVTITVSTSTAVLITDLDTPIELPLPQSDGTYWITCRIVDENGNSMFRGGAQVICVDSIMPSVWASFVWENPPAGTYTVYGRISTSLVSDSDLKSVASGEATTTFTVVGPPSDVPGFSNIPNNQGTAHNPNL